MVMGPWCVVVEYFVIFCTLAATRELACLREERQGSGLVRISGQKSDPRRLACAEGGDDAEERRATGLFI